MKPATKVWYNAGEEDKIGFFIAHGRGNDTTKDTIQLADGSHQGLAFREPKDRDSAGSGRTYWPV